MKNKTNVDVGLEKVEILMRLNSLSLAALQKIEQIILPKAKVETVEK
jgi:hypothetical protein